LARPRYASSISWESQSDSVAGYERQWFDGFALPLLKKFWSFEELGGHQTDNEVQKMKVRAQQPVMAWPPDWYSRYFPVEAG
jgi:hypothetical protein